MPYTEEEEEEEEEEGRGGEVGGRGKECWELINE